MTRFHGLIFDLDDTLYPEIQYVFSGFKAVAQWCFDLFGCQPGQTYEQLVTSYRNGIRGDTFDQWFAARGLDSSYAKEAVEVYRGHDPVISCFPGLTDMLNRLKSTHRLGIVTDGRLEVQQRKLAALGVAHLFDAIIFSDQWGREFWKPHPRPFLAALEQMKIKSGDAVYVADNPRKDFVGARSLGIWTVQLSTPDGVYGSEKAPTPGHAPDAVIRSVLELEGLLSA